MDSGTKVIPNENLKTFGVRHIQVSLFFFGLALAMAMRVNLSVAIVAMTNKDGNPDFNIIDWDQPTRGIILSSFFWGYVVTQLPSGLIAHRFGAKIVFITAITGAGILNILTPTIAPMGWQWMCVIRTANGLFQGCVFPCVHTLLSKWVHPSERALLSVISLSGSEFGIFIMMLVSGMIADSKIGWPGIFYVSGSAGLLWSLLWFIYGNSSPADCKRISLKERNYLEQSLGTLDRQHRLPLPWKSIVTSLPFLAILITHMCQNFGYYTLLTEIPAYMNAVLEFNITNTALLSAMPYIVMFLLGLIFSPISDYLMNRKYISIGNGRKLFNTIGHWLPAICFIGLGFVTIEHTSIAVTLLVFSVGFNSGATTGYLLNHMDLSPNFAGTLLGITNTFANIISMIAPLTVGYIVTDEKNVTLWQIVFFITAGIYFCGNLLFIIFGSGSIQHWNEASKK